MLAFYAPVDWAFLSRLDAGEPPADAPVRAAIASVLAFPAATQTTYDLPGHDAIEDHEAARQALMIEASPACPGALAWLLSPLKR